MNNLNRKDIDINQTTISNSHILLECVYMTNIALKGAHMAQFGSQVLSHIVS